MSKQSIIIGAAQAASDQSSNLKNNKKPKAEKPKLTERVCTYLTTDELKAFESVIGREAYSSVVRKLILKHTNEQK